MDALDLVSNALRPLRSVCRVPRDLAEITAHGPEVPAQSAGARADAPERVWRRVETLYRTGLYPAIQICVRHRGLIVLNRAIGHARGNSPTDPPRAAKVAVDVDTPITIYSAAKAVTAMLIHKLDERGLIRLDDRVCDYIPEFGSHGKDSITIRHVLGHRAGIPNLPPEAMDLDRLADPGLVVEILCGLRPLSRPGRRLAYHATSGGFVLGELVQRVTGQDIREVLHKEIREPLGFRWFSYGVAPEDVGKVAINAFTGFPAPPPFSTLLERVLGRPMKEIIALSNDPRFLTSIIPSANIVTNALELSAFYQCLLDGGVLDGVRIFDPRTIRRATLEQSYWEIDLTLGIPLRYGLGFMLGAWSMGLFGPDTPHAFGHLGFTNIVSWADPERELAVALITTGKPLISIDVIRLYQVLSEIGRAFPKLPTTPA